MPFVIEKPDGSVLVELNDEETIALFEAAAHEGVDVETFIRTEIGTRYLLAQAGEKGIEDLTERLCNPKIEKKSP